MVIEVFTGFILDWEVLSKYCKVCETKENALKQKQINENTFRTFQVEHKPTCTKNYEESSGGMEAQMAVRMFQRSKGKKLIYENIVSDGDSSTFKSLKALNDGAGPYPNVEIKKLECINHVQKRMGTRLRKLRDEVKTDVITKTGNKMRRSCLAGKDKLTDKAITTITSYYGNAIRGNIGKTFVDMKVAVMRIYYHSFSSGDNQHHGLCPKGPESWCFFQRQLASGKAPDKIETKKNRSLSFKLTEEDEKKVKAVFESLSSEDILKRCLRGLTQNKNESFHSKMWARAKKI